MKREIEKGNIALMFPGVGSQYFRMGEELYKNYPIIRETFKEASDAINVDLFKICFAEDDGKINMLEYAKPALVCLSTAIYRLYMQEVGAKPRYCIGYSLGEYSALCCAGILKLQDALKIVRERAAIINEVSSKVAGTMAWVINIQKNIADELCKEVFNSGYEIYVSSYDSKAKLSVSGTYEAIEKYAEKVEDAGGIVLPIKMSGPFHSPLMKEATCKLKALLGNYEFHDSQYNVIANRNACVYTNCREKIIENLSMQLCKPILWDESLQFVIDDGITFAIELGPKNVLKYLTETYTNKIKAFSIEKKDDINFLLSDNAFNKSLYITK